MNFAIRHTIQCLLTALGLLLFAGANLFAGTPDTSAEYRSLKVISATSDVVGTKVGESIGLGGGVEVEVQGLDKYLNANPSRQLSEFVLYLDARPVASLPARRVSIAGVNKDRLRFDLRRIKTDRGSNINSWDALLGSPSMWPGSHKEIPVTVGLPDQPIETAASANFDIVPKLGGIIGFVCVAAVLTGIIALGWRTDLLRDSGEAADGTRKAFSLARVQLAIWFCTALASFVFIWSVTGETSSLTGQALSLLGISTMTFIGSTAMDSRNADIDQKRINTAKDELSTKEQKQRIIEEKVKTDDAVERATLTAEQNKISAEIMTLESAVKNVQKRLKDHKKSATFFRDILSDEHGISLHRFQLFAWTIVVAAIFLQQVWQQLAMPANLDGNLLTLMGLSSGTFVGMKATETTTASQQSI